MARFAFRYQFEMFTMFFRVAIQKECQFPYISQSFSPLSTSSNSAFVGVWHLIKTLHDAKANESSGLAFHPRSDGSEVIAHMEKTVREGMSHPAPEKRDEAGQRLAEVIANPAPLQRSGAILDNVVAFLRRVEKPEIEPREIVNAVAPNASASVRKAVYNAIQYLERSGRIMRVSHGRYLVAGVGKETSDDLGGEPARYEGD